MALSGKVVRRAGKQAGLHFDFPTTPSDWTHKSKGERKVAHVMAERPDRYPHATSSTALPHSAITRDDLLALADMIEALGDSMSEDSLIVERYLARLQVLDVAGQKLRQLATRV